MFAVVAVPFWIAVAIVVIRGIYSRAQARAAAEQFAATMKQCPACAETIRREALICRFCHTPQGAGQVAGPEHRHVPANPLRLQTVQDGPTFARRRVSDWT